MVETSPQTCSTDTTFSHSPFSNGQRMNACDSQKLGLSHIFEGKKTAQRQLQHEGGKDLCGKLNLATSLGASDSALFCPAAHSNHYHSTYLPNQPHSAHLELCHQQLDRR